MLLIIERAFIFADLLYCYWVLVDDIIILWVVWAWQSMVNIENKATLCGVDISAYRICLVWSGLFDLLDSYGRYVAPSGSWAAPQVKRKVKLGITARAFSPQARPNLMFHPGSYLMSRSWKQELTLALCSYSTWSHLSHHCLCDYWYHWSAAICLFCELIPTC